VPDEKRTCKWNRHGVWDGLVHCSDVQCRAIARALRVPYLPQVRAGDAVAVDLRALLSPRQRDAWDAVVATRALLCGRRAGKTWWAAAWLLDGAQRSPHSLSVYLALTQRSARYIVWPVLRDVCRAAGIDAVFSDHTLTVTLPNGAQIIVAGTDDARTIETWRGTKLRRAIVDECGSQPEYLGYLYREILKPATLDLDGELAFCGTPPVLLSGFWYDMVNEHSKMGVLVKTWTVLDNPFIEDAERKLREVREEMGWTEDSPPYQREWMARCVADAGELVFPFDFKSTPEFPYGPNGCAFDPDGAHGLPSKNEHGKQIDPTLWRYVKGVDVAVVRRTAISVVAAHPDFRENFVVQTEAHERWIVDQLAVRMRELDETFPGPTVLDCGGMGKLHAEELTRRFGIGFEAAEKTQKESHVREYRDRIRARRSIVVDGAQNDAIRGESATIGWDKDGRLPNPLHLQDVMDATMYAERKLFHYRDEDAVPEFVAQSPEWQAKQIADIEAARRARSQRDTRAARLGRVA
jgi:hypothetical protein